MFADFLCPVGFCSPFCLPTFGMAFGSINAALLFSKISSCYGRSEDLADFGLSHNKSNVTLNKCE